MATEQRQQGQEQSGGETPNPVQIQKFLGGLDYPVDKQAILGKAREQGADQRVMDALEQLPERAYDSPVSISREVSKLG
ncbi:DUF2795 domain-containing protein [Azoarcus indigens]|uniref:Uncharacterized protein DUF2795 n=1 Tax=Azoarcus indigens TaxID=29545 RepID=A0A4R6DUZ0_9RHOO|nr:DUF2795 domain-containing protein [Azoarcus indigens]NMG68009.1 DUF2795 domain-containing protein [Azoarcus indigens]TDN48439.1 uncharacterized protein DUF2795 [Azoarcus indigens]